ncbi:SIS domain-containing protein [Opitutaceae bacterium]|nr:SIS domain-containing protein [Opitutaceae bacterium]
MTSETWINQYLDAEVKLIRSLPTDKITALIDIFEKAHSRDSQIFLFGNGGNAASASHLACDLGKGASDVLKKRFRVITLNDNAAWLTALGNDYAYDDVFVRQLENYARPGDVVLSGSVSGNSPNLVKAFEWANAQKLTTVSITSSRRGRMSDLATLPIVLPDEHYGRVEDMQMMIYHLIAFWFIENKSA